MLASAPALTLASSGCTKITTSSVNTKVHGSIAVAVKVSVTLPVSPTAGV